MGSKKDREKRLLLLLSKNQGYMTSEELAQLLETSQKTVYRVIKGINDNYSDGVLIESEKGKGYKLNYEKYISQYITQSSRKSNYSPAERRNRIMERLLLSSPRSEKVYELFEPYYVGDSVIFNDEQRIASKLKEYDLTLERKQRTLAVIGKEANIRRAIADLIQMHNIIDIDELKSNQELNFNNYDVLFILDQLRVIEEQLDITIPYPYNVNIFSHIYILISRSRKVGLLKLSDNHSISEEEQEELQNDLSLYRVAKTTISNVENYLHQELPEVEVYYLYQYLVSSRMQGIVRKMTSFSTKVVEVTQTYLNEMSAYLNISINSDSIFLDLANHIKPMLNRLVHNIRVKNSLLDQIKITYEDIFEYVSEVSKVISEKYNLPVINQDENGFITLYFARIIETNQLPIRTLIMCTTGVGTSELLKVKIKKNFPELEVVDVVSTRDSKKYLERYPEVELILTTTHLNENLPVKTLLVSAMLTADDQNRIQQKIKEINNEK
ncbi:BglG family transcription antiterminator [Gracilibacillus alcaliphilus]|uniref:BglG family transcription antiterminator n=1 Tax=Gracilibacillus alcaliphilus TaxID=1401441 RepID=UPI00195C2FFF|nr:PRD domain-containing protein [Gracilibacillus alcaliphilus]MBM7677990.1 transcriptional antiterminator [Gracilibacillus alcaliphilus]